MISSAVITGAGSPLVNPFINQLLCCQLEELVLCGTPPDLQALAATLPSLRDQQSPATALDFQPLDAVLAAPSLEQLVEFNDQTLLLHGQLCHHPEQLEHRPCQAVHRNLLLTRQMLQTAIADSPNQLVVLSSEHAGHTDTVLGASLAAAEASILEATRCLHDVPILVVRLPLCLASIALESCPPERRLLGHRAVQAVISQLFVHQEPDSPAPLHQLLHWPDAINDPQQLELAPLPQAVRQPRMPLTSWLALISEPLQAYEQQRVRQALLALWSNPSPSA